MKTKQIVLLALAAIVMFCMSSCADGTYSVSLGMPGGFRPAPTFTGRPYIAGNVAPGYFNGVRPPVPMGIARPMPCPPQYVNPVFVQRPSYYQQGFGNPAWNSRFGGGFPCTTPMARPPVRTFIGGRGFY